MPESTPGGIVVAKSIDLHDWVLQDHLMYAPGSVLPRNANHVGGIYRASAEDQEVSPPLLVKRRPSMANTTELPVGW